MANDGNGQGSTPLGAMFLISVFGPMALLALLWALAAGVGAPGAARDFFMDLMIWVLLGAGAVLLVEEAALIALTWFKRPGSNRNR